MAIRLAVGLMSGTSMDGIDAALIETDGAARARSIASATTPYDPAFRARLADVAAGALDPLVLEAELTDRHAVAVDALLVEAGVAAAEIAVVGFHGQTVLHRPAERRTWQIGDGQRLANRLGIDVAFDFRSADVAAGGQGAPLAPVYHAALAAKAPERPLGIVNIGGVANVTWIGVDGELVACDVGPGNGPIDDWVKRHTGRAFDADGAIARAGAVAQDRVADALSAGFFATSPPKSLDRMDFTDRLAEGLSLEDGAATLAEFTAAAIVASGDVLPSPPKLWLATGGGRHNSFLMARLAALANAPVRPIEAIGVDGDALEAEAFAYLAVRTTRGLPISFPGTTGAPKPLCGGRIARAQR